MVLYELITSQLPFKGEYEHAVVYSILNLDPEPVTDLQTEVPKELERITHKALVKNANERYQHVNEILGDLNRLQDKSKIDMSSEKALIPKKKVYLATAILAILVFSIIIVFLLISPKPKEPIDLLAVLPFDNLSIDPDQDVLAAQVTDALILELNRISALDVISRTSILHYKDTDKTMPEIAQELNVPVLVEGSVFQHEDSMRIIVQLIDGAADKHIWSNDYMHEIKNIFSLQKKIAQDIANEINIALTLEEKARFAQQGGVNYEAYKFYSLGIHYKAFDTGWTKSRSYFEQAIEEDPNFAPAWAALARTYMVSDTSKARAFLTRALEMDKNLSDA